MHEHCATGYRFQFHRRHYTNIENIKVSLIIDEATDRSVTAQMAILAFDRSDFENDRLLIDLIDVAAEKSDMLYAEMMSALESEKVPTTNTIGICSDTYTTMFGAHTSVLQQYSVLEHYSMEMVFCESYQYERDILGSLRNKFSEAYLEFLESNFGQLTQYSLLFQSELSLPHRLDEEVNKLLKVYAPLGRIYIVSKFVSE